MKEASFDYLAIYRKFFFFGILLLKNHYFHFSYNFHIFERTLKFFIQQENYQHSFKIAGFFDAIPVRPGISLGVWPPK
jgi:hypothetical protein